MGGALKTAASVSAHVISKLDEKKQKKEHYSISTLGNILELDQMATDTASLLTLYYREQIQSIDVSRKIKGSNIWNDKIQWIKDVLVDVRPEGDEAMPVVMVAEFVTGWIVEALRAGEKKLVPTEPLPQQLWLCVAEENCADQGKGTAVSSILGVGASRQKIPIKIQGDNGAEVSVHVQLRHLIGCVSVVTSDGTIYQHPILRDSPDKDLADLQLYGYVYVTPFLSDGQSVQSIIDGRKLEVAKRDDGHRILTKVQDIEEHVRHFKDRDDRTRQSNTKSEAAGQIAQVLRDQKAFVDPKDVTAALNKSRQEVEFSIDVLREDMQSKTDYYQASIDATSEKLEKDITQAREALKKENEDNYNHGSKKLTGKLTEIQIHLENQSRERMDTMEKQLTIQCEKMQKLVEAARADADLAWGEAKKAARASEKSAEQSEQANEQVKKLTETTERRCADFQNVIETCKTSVKQTMAEETARSEQATTALRTKVQQDFERTKQAAEQASASAKESMQKANESVKSAQEMQKDSRRQLDLQKEETNKVVAEAKEVTRQNERSAGEAKEASKQTKQGADATAAALKKVETMYEKMEKALERLEKLSRQLE